MKPVRKVLTVFFLGGVLSLWGSGCATTLVEDRQEETQQPTEMVHCSGSESVDQSSVAVLPVPVAAFFVPHAQVHEIKADAYLKKCGEPQKLVHRRVELDKTGCIPAGLTRIITLGIWQWCPASVSWEADVIQTDYPQHPQAAAQ